MSTAQTAAHSRVGQLPALLMVPHVSGKQPAPRHDRADPRGLQQIHPLIEIADGTDFFADLRQESLDFLSRLVGQVFAKHAQQAAQAADGNANVVQRFAAHSFDRAVQIHEDDLELNPQQPPRGLNHAHVGANQWLAVFLRNRRGHKLDVVRKHSAPEISFTVGTDEGFGKPVTANRHKNSPTRAADTHNFRCLRVAVIQSIPNPQEGGQLQESRGSSTCRNFARVTNHDLADLLALRLAKPLDPLLQHNLGPGLHMVHRIDAVPDIVQPRRRL
jgi:hypothetical protein